MTTRVTDRYQDLGHLPPLPARKEPLLYLSIGGFTSRCATRYPMPAHAEAGS